MGLGWDCLVVLVGPGCTGRREAAGSFLELLLCSCLPGGNLLSGEGPTRWPVGTWNRAGAGTVPLLSSNQSEAAQHLSRIRPKGPICFGKVQWRCLELGCGLARFLPSWAPTGQPQRAFKGAKEPISLWSFPSGVVFSFSTEKLSCWVCLSALLRVLRRAAASLAIVLVIKEKQMAN